MRCAVMQPTFLPWAGYFRLMLNVDRFVFLDDVQLAKQSWQTRNRILLAERIHWIIVPIRHGGLEQTIAGTQIADPLRWRSKIGRVLRQSYARHPFAADLDALISCLEDHSHTRMADLNIAVITCCADMMGILTPTARTMEMNIQSNQRPERLVEICRMLKCDTYVSPAGSADYMIEDGLEHFGEIKIEFVSYSPPTYPQFGRSRFVSHLSIVDVIANLGWQGGADYLRRSWPR